MKNQRRPPFLEKQSLSQVLQAELVKLRQRHLQNRELILCWQQEEKKALTETAELCRKLGATVLVVPTDTSVAEDVQNLVKETLEFTGKIDYWVNNAECWHLVNLRKFQLMSVIRLLKQTFWDICIRHMQCFLFSKTEKGVLLNNISIGWMPAPYGTAYTASKFGVREW